MKETVAAQAADTLDDVYRTHGGRLLALAAALAGASDAPDLVAGVFSKLIDGPGLSGVRTPSAYLNRALINEVRAQRRSTERRRARESTYQSARLPAAAVTPADDRVLVAVRQLPVRQRAALFLTYWADLTPVEVARELSISEGSVRKHLARARSALREELL